MQGEPPRRTVQAHRRTTHGSGDQFGDQFGDQELPPRRLRSVVQWAVPVCLMLGLVASAYHAAWTARQAPLRYREAMMAALGVAEAPLPKRALPAWPRARTLHPPTQDLRVGFWDLLTVQGCKLGVLLGERNSPLGRVMPASERLVYELQLLAALPRCQVQDAALRDELKVILNHKRSDIPAHLISAVWGGPEMREMLTADFADDSIAHVDSAAQALRGLSRYVEQPHVDPGAIRLHLEALHRHRAAGGLLQQASRSLQALTAVADALERASTSAASTDCRQSRSVTQAFQNHYVGSFQPQLARLQQPLEEMLAALEGLWQSAPQPQSLAGFAEAAFGTRGQSLRGRLVHASRRHARAILVYAEQCNIQLVDQSAT